ncbi:MAG: TraM recognition domain-containing protein [bacterium]
MDILTFFQDKLLEFFASPLAGVILFWSFIFLVLVGAIAIFVKRLRRKHKAELGSRLKIFTVFLPKESAEKKGESERSKSLSELQEDIAVMENLFSAIGGLKPETTIHSLIYGRHDVFSFEIVVKGGLIYFYVATPSKYADYLTQQIHAQFPMAQVNEAQDYNIFSPQGVIKAGYLKFRRPGFFPIKTYKKLEADPLNSLTNVLSKIGAEDGAAIQIVLRPAGDSWRKSGVRVASEIQQGKKVSQVLGELGAWGQIWSIFRQGGVVKKEEKEAYRLSPLEEEMVRALEEKASKAGAEANIRIIASSANEATAAMYAANIANAFSQYSSYQYGNTFLKSIPSMKDTVRDFIFRSFSPKHSMLLNTEELSSIYHFPLPTTETPNIAWLLTRQAAPPNNLPQEGLVLGKSVYRGKEALVQIKTADRLRHTYIIGRSGTGKTYLQQGMAVQDIKNGNGLCVIDPHGDFAGDLIAQIPKERVEDLIYFNPSDLSRPMGLNLLEYDPKYPEQKTFVINEMINILDKLYDLKSTGGPMFEQYIRNAMLLIMADPESGSTLMEISKVLADAEFRKYKLSKCKDQLVYDFWTKEAEKAGGEAALANMVPYITSKLNQFISNDTMRPIIGQQESAFNFREAMDSKKIIIVNLSKGKIGELNSFLLGLVIVGKILAAALSRADLPEKERNPFYLYIDEFQNYITPSIAIILSEARKYGLGLVIAHQYISQLVRNNDTSIRDAVFGNAGTIISFRIGVEDAEFLEKEFAPVFNARDLINIESRNAYIKLLIDNSVSRPFNMQTLPIPVGNPPLGDKIKQLARLKYGRDRRLVELEIRKRTRI